VWISIKNIIFLHFACVRPFFPLSLDLGDFSFHLCAPLFKLRTPPLFCFCLDSHVIFFSSWLVHSHVIFSHLGSSCALREQFCRLPVLWFSCRTSLPFSFHASVLTAAKIVLGLCFCHSAPCVTCSAAGAISIFLVHT
jgi:hypothetical protein